MTSELQDIIQRSTFTPADGVYVYAKTATYPANDCHFLVTKDADEITIVTQKEHVSQLALIERNKDDYALIALNVSSPFYSVGFLAAVSSAIATQGMNCLIVSTYSKDYLLVRHDQRQTAIDVLLHMGFSQQKSL